MKTDANKHISFRLKHEIQNPERDIAIAMAVLDGIRPIDIERCCGLSSSRARHIFFRICKLVDRDLYMAGAQRAGLKPVSKEHAMKYLIAHREKLLDGLMKLAGDYNVERATLSRCEDWKNEVEASRNKVLAITVAGEPFPEKPPADAIPELIGRLKLELKQTQVEIKHLIVRKHELSKQRKLIEDRIRALRARFTSLEKEEQAEG